MQLNRILNSKGIKKGGFSWPPDILYSEMETHS